VTDTHGHEGAVTVEIRLQLGHPAAVALDEERLAGGVAAERVLERRLVARTVGGAQAVDVAAHAVAILERLLQVVGADGVADEAELFLRGLQGLEPGALGGGGLAQGVVHDHGRQVR
jgi:hypothetical protein